MKSKKISEVINMLRSPFRRSSFSRAQLIIFVIVFGAIGYIIYRSFAAGPLVGSLEAEQMNLPAGASVVTDSSASGGQAVQFSANGQATGTVNLSGSVTSIGVNARSTQCQGSPGLSVAIDGSTLLSTTVSTGSWTTFSANTNLAAGSHQVSITASNVPKKGGGKKATCSIRTLYVDVTNFYGSTPPPPPPPTVSLSAAPSAVSAGQASTLTWSSTNADQGCTASGAWSGSQAASGSQSTGSLNQTSTYNLTCTGTGGSASASTTVTVNTSTVPPPPTVYLNPLSQTYSLGSTVTLEVHENSGTTAVNAVQANFSYPTDKLTFVSIDASASPFTTQAQSTGGNGQVTLARGIIGTLTGDQLIAKVTFTVNSVAGTASLPFTTGTALITSATNQNLITSLSLTGGGTYTLQ